MTAIIFNKAFDMNSPESTWLGNGNKDFQSTTLSGGDMFQYTYASGSDTNVLVDMSFTSNLSQEQLSSFTDISYTKIIQHVFSTLSGNDVITGSTGNDTLLGKNGNDILDGNLGDDWLNGGSGSDWAYYNNSNSAVSVNLAINELQNTQGAGNDLLISIENLSGTAYADTLIGNSVANIINGNGGNDHLYGDFGNDIIFSGGKNDIINGGNGIDWAYYSSAEGGVNVNLSITQPQKTIHAGLDTLIDIENILGSTHNDVMKGNYLSNTLIGNTGDDLLFGLSGNDKLYGGVGDDKLNGGQGNDRLEGGAGNDFVYYTEIKLGVSINLGIKGGQNTIHAGVDTLINIENVSGSNHNDVLIGNKKANTLSGILGNDTLDGSLGNDRLIGGLGKDIFKFTTAATTNNKDVIVDFNVRDDSIQLDNNIFSNLVKTGVLANDIFKIGTAAIDANDYIIYNKITGQLLYDQDGNGASTAVPIAILANHATLTHTDIFVV